MSTPRGSVAQSVRDAAAAAAANAKSQRCETTEHSPRTVSIQPAPPLRQKLQAELQAEKEAREEAEARSLEQEAAALQEAANRARVRAGAARPDELSMGSGASGSPWAGAPSS